MMTSYLRWLLWSALGAIALLTWGSALNAQTGYNLAWYSIDGGATVNNGGGYTVHKVVGQADAGQLTSGDYTLTGGVLAVAGAPPAETDSSLFLPKLAR